MSFRSLVWSYRSHARNQELLAVLALLLGALSIPTSARAQCGPGETQCGDSYCSDSSYQCCAYVGRPDISCAPGSTCTANGCETSGSDPGGGGVTCSSGTQLCGSDHCAAIGNECCAYVGRSDISCAPGSTCTPDGCVSDGGSSDSCGAGTELCGTDHCSPIGNECCDYVGRPDINCAPGSTCTADGCVADGTDYEPGEDSCPVGTSQCGSSYCSPIENDCCSYVDRPDISCPVGSYCTESGCYSEEDDSPVSPDSSDPMSSTPTTGTAGRITMEGDYLCSPEGSSSSCTVRYCLRPDMAACYYEVDGEPVTCTSCTSSDALTECAKRAAALCNDSSSDEDSGGCSTVGGRRSWDTSWFALALIALWRRRSTRTA
jgi:hypothetical protein